MSYKSHAQNELTNYTDATDAEKEIIYQCLEVVSEQGHSGGSIGFIISHLEALAADPNRSIEKDGMVWPIIQPAKHLPVEQQLRLFRWLHLIVAFQPLSPLTGEDSEWNRLGYDDDTRYQNRRCSRIFKDADGSTYDIDGRTTYYPSSSYCTWSGCGAPSTLVTFPYTPTTERVFYLSEASRIRIPAGVDPHALLETWWWLYLSGVDPVTGKFRKEAVFCTEEQAIEAKAVYDSQLAGLTYKNRYDSGLYVGEYEITGNAEIDEAAKEADAAKQRAARIFSLVGRFTLLRENIYLGDDGIEYQLVYLPVRRPDRNYQCWRPMYNPGGSMGAWVLCQYNSRRPDRELEPLHYDVINGNYEIIAGDQDDYLYTKRRELGLSHPSRKRIVRETVYDASPVGCAAPDTEAEPATVPSAVMDPVASMKLLADAYMRRIDENTSDMYNNLFNITHVYRSNALRRELREQLDSKMEVLFAKLAGSCVDGPTCALVEAGVYQMVDELKTAYPNIVGLNSPRVDLKCVFDGGAVTLEPSEELRAILEPSHRPLEIANTNLSHDELRDWFRRYYKTTFGE